MKKLNLANVNEATQGAFKQPSNDRYLCVITKVEDFPEKEYLRLEYDIAQGEFKGYYTKRNKERQWSMPSTIRSYKDSALPFFKGLITSLEKTNPKFKWKDNEQDMVGKGVCFVLQDEEYLKQDGKVGTRTQVIEIHSKEFMQDGSFVVPETKKLTQTPPTQTFSGFNSGSSASMFDDDEDVNPFTEPKTKEVASPVPDDENIFDLFDE